MDRQEWGGGGGIYVMSSSVDDHIPGLGPQSIDVGSDGPGLLFEFPGSGFLLFLSCSSWVPSKYLQQLVLVGLGCCGKNSLVWEAQVLLPVLEAARVTPRGRVLRQSRLPGLPGAHSEP